MDLGGFQQASENVTSLIQQYRETNGAHMAHHADRDAGPPAGQSGAASNILAGGVDPRTSRKRAALRFL